MWTITSPHEFWTTLPTGLSTYRSRIVLVMGSPAVQMTHKQKSWIHFFSLYAPDTSTTRLTAFESLMTQLLAMSPMGITRTFAGANILHFQK